MKEYNLTPNEIEKSKALAAEIAKVLTEGKGSYDMAMQSLAYVQSGMIWNAGDLAGATNMEAFCLAQQRRHKKCVRSMLNKLLKKNKYVDSKR